MSNRKKTYYLCPNWDFHPCGPLRLGNLITSKNMPGEGLNGPRCPRPASYIPNPAPDPETTTSSPPEPIIPPPNTIYPPTTQNNVTWSTTAHRSGHYALYTEFLSSLTGLGIDLSTDHTSSTSELYHFRELVTEKFTPTREFVQACIDASSAARDYVSASRFRKHLYLVTSVKVAKGASVKTLYAKSRGGEVGVTVDGTLMGGAPVSVGPSVGREWGRSEGGAFEDASDFVFAFGLHRVVVRRAEKGEGTSGVRVVGVPSGYTSGAMYDTEGKPVQRDGLVVDVEASGESTVADFRESQGKDKPVFDVDGEEVVCVRPF